MANNPLSLVEAREAEAAANQHKAFVEACEKVCGPDVDVDHTIPVK